MPVLASQTRMVDRHLTRDDFGSIGRECDGLNPSLWPRRGGSISTPVLASQTRMVLSSDPEMILDPSGENATEVIKSSWPRRGGSISMPVLASQTRMVLSSDPEMILDPSGENATESNPVIMASKGWEHLDASACIPNSNGLVI
jgi:uncharacterized protein YfaA (DUF2138 family)